MEKHADETTIDIENNFENTVENNLENTVENNLENTVENNFENTVENNLENTVENNKITFIKYISEGVGWIGSVLVLIPYVTPINKTTDFILNTLGASGLFIVCLTSKQHQSVIINAAWIIGGIYKYYS